MADEFLEEIRELYKTKEYAKIVEVWGRDGSNSDQFKTAAFANYSPAKGDVIISTYPKSGTTWTMQMAYQIGYLGEGGFDHIDHVIPWPDKLIPLDGNPEVGDVSHLADSPTGLHVIKSHLEATFIPYTAEAKYIHVVRDPKDMLVSLVHFENGFNKLLFDEIVPPQIWIDTFSSDKFIYQSWPMFIDSWWSLNERENVLILIFEEMKADSRGTIQRIADFLEIELTAEQLDKVAEKSGFQYMKTNAAKFDPPAWDQGPVTLVREGKTGGAQSMLTQAQQAHVDAFCLREFAARGSTFPYAEKFGLVTK